MESTSNLLLWAAICQTISGFITYRMSVFMKYIDLSMYDVFNEAGPSSGTIVIVYRLTETINVIFFILGFFYMDSWWQPIAACFVLPAILSAIIGKSIETNTFIVQVGCVLAPVLSVVSMFLLFAN